MAETKGQVLMTEAQRRLVELEKQKTEYKRLLDELKLVTEAVAKEVGINGFFQDEEGTVYKIVVPGGKWIPFEAISYVRTKREGEKTGSLSIKEAKEAGFEI